MPRQPKAKNTLSAGQRALLYEQEMKKKAERLKSSAVAEGGEADGNSADSPNATSSRAEQAVERVNAAPEYDVISDYVAPKKPKPTSASVRVDLAETRGALSVPYGISGSPIGDGADITHLYRGAHISCVRPCDTCQSPVGGAFNIFEIFRNPDADERLEENYCFRKADRQVMAVQSTGAQLIYSLYICPEEGASEAVMRLMRDRGRLARICVNIVRHYNDYWCGGFALGIKNFEIILPEGTMLGAGGTAQAEMFETYVRISDGIKLYDGTLCVGGICFRSLSRACRDFLRYLSESNAPLDFLSISVRVYSPEHMYEQIEQYAKMLRGSRYAGARILVSQLEYIPSIDGVEHPEAVMRSVSASYAERKRELFLKQRSVCGASFATSAFIRLAGMSDVSHACMLCETAGSHRCVICDGFGIAEKPYYALEAFGRVMSEPYLVACTSMQDQRYAHTGVYAVASCGESEAYIMLSSFDGVTSIDLRLMNIPDSFYTADIYMLDGVKDMELCNSIQLAGLNKRMVMSVSQYSVILIKLY